MPHTLPIGSVVGGLEITGLIGEGGFGIVYLAFDNTLHRQVALKEYMPSTLASRASNLLDVSVKSPRLQETFDAGLRSFVNEARLLAHFDHPALVKVHQFWQGNRTAYMVMPFYEGPTLKVHVRDLSAKGQSPDEATLRGWLTPLLDALELMHDEQCFHRDIAPDNIILTPRGPLLLDFGAARRVISDMTQALTVILKPGYAPIEQYGDAATMVQGPWTDLYALASVVYYCITGRSPITSVERMMGDPLPLLAQVAEGRYGQTFLQAIDAALAVRPADRPQSVAELKALLAGTSMPRKPAPRGPARPGADVEPTMPLARSQTQAPAVAAKPASTPATPPPPMPAPASPGGKGGKVAIVLAGVAALAVAAGFALRTREAAPPAAPAAGARPPLTAASLPAATPALTPVLAAASASEAAASAPAPKPNKPKAEPKPRPTPAKADAALKPSTAPATGTATAPGPAPAIAAAPPAAAAKPSAPSGRPARCAEVLERGNKGTLSLEEANFLRKECR